MRRIGLALLLLAAPPATAQEVCNALRDGAVSCMSGRLCLCRYERGGQLTGRPDGFRWDCGAFRPACGPEAFPPALSPEAGAGAVAPWISPQVIVPVPPRGGPPRPQPR